MMKTKSLFVKLPIFLAILVCGIVIGRYLLSAKPEAPKIKKAEFKRIMQPHCNPN